MSSTFPILIAWGPETIQLYNDSYRPICGAKHPESMGQNFRICWETALPVVGDAFTRGQQGEGTYIKDQRMFLDRNGYLEEAFMTFSFAPIRDESGQVGGIFHPITETTDKMLSARRTHVLREVAARTGGAQTNAAIYAGLASAQAEFALDVPFLLVYELDPDGQQARLTQASGLTTPPGPELSSLAVMHTPWLADLTRQQVIPELAQTVGRLSGGPYEEWPHTALLLPIQLSTKAQPIGFLLAGVSPRRALDEDYLNFYGLLGNTITTAFANVYAYQQEQQRAEALAAIDRAKTAFFSNISHEFRTPLTLMLGPLEELLRDARLADSGYQESIEAAHRNAQRLLKLVNNLLDFSRLEAGRVQARYQPIDLVGLTLDLASSFRSLIEKAGLRLAVNGQPLKSQVYADPGMWEQIVLNLLSNAFKYTLTGQISVQVSEEANQAVLRVSDTGVGIPEAELPHMFERFHRVANAGGRTYEGTGIGLSLVSELVKLHQGTISVSSQEGQGSTFIVRLPLGKAHLPESQLIEQLSLAGTRSLTEAFLQEATTMLSVESAPLAKSHVADPDGEISVLVVDDNADMRAYLTRLLTPYFRVYTVQNGLDALQQLTEHRPHLILSDLMMPVMDGIELLSRVRHNPTTAHIPLIFLSARAGQEARIECLEAGADDYLVKPFSGLELLSKVRAQISLSQARQQAQWRLRNLIEQAPAAMMLLKGESLVIELINQAMLGLIDWQGDVIGKSLLAVMPELVGQPAVEACRQVLHTGIPYQGWALAVPVRRGDQLVMGYFNVSYTPYLEGGVRTGVLQIAIDVTDQVIAHQEREVSEARYRHLSTHLDQQVQERTEQLQVSIQDLQRSNQNLAQFAYVASHDLQEPLRKIQQFGDLLKTYFTHTTGEELIYVDRMQSAASRMSTLIKDLLSFSRIASRQEVWQPIELTAVLGTVLSDLEIRIKETGAQVTVSPLPCVVGDSSQLGQLFQNLLTNALKFTQAGQVPLIQIKADTVLLAQLPPGVKPSRLADGYYRISVIDQGIGFEQQYARQIFEVFQRLHGKNKYSGTGIGLAICEKVVINHGGAIMAQSQPGQGSTFSIYLPI
ncbi:hypothetical protein GCM10028818_52350 [Spirosoma horti]